MSKPVRELVRDGVWRQVSGQVWGWDQIGSGRVWDQVLEQVKDQIEEEVWS